MRNRQFPGRPRSRFVSELCTYTAQCLAAGASQLQRPTRSMTYVGGSSSTHLHRGTADCGPTNADPQQSPTARVARAFNGVRHRVCLCSEKETG